MGRRLFREQKFMVAAVTMCFVFLGLSLRYYQFTLDDAYITLRYSKHLANGHGVVWNISSDPVEGYSSTLWMLIGSGAHVLGLPPVQTLKIAGIVAGMVTIAGLGWSGNRMDAPPVFIVMALAVIALSPAMAVLAVQGMETTLVMLFILSAAVATIELTESYSCAWAIVLGISITGAMFTRPGSVVFGGGLLVGLTVLYLYQSKRDEAVGLVLTEVLFVLVPGIMFLGIRWWYFGYPLPNSFYIKETSRFIEIAGVLNVAEFLTVVVGPFLVLSVYGSLRTDSTVADDWIRALPLTLGIGGFLSVWFFVRPVQAYLWRYQAPVLPALLVLLLFISRESRPIRIRPRITPESILTVVVLLAVVAFPLHTVDDAGTEVGNRDQVDRVRVGQSLEPLAGAGYKMVVTESGALPYYSDWYAIDELGLNSEHIAHQGLSQPYLAKIDPDLIMVLVESQPGLYEKKSKPLATYLENEGYQIAMVSEKSGSSDKYHVYFVDPESRGKEEISCELRKTRGIDQVSPQYFVDLAEINTSAIDSTARGC